MSPERKSFSPSRRGRRICVFVNLAGSSLDFAHYELNVGGWDTTAAAPDRVSMAHTRMDTPTHHFSIPCGSVDAGVRQYYLDKTNLSARARFDLSFRRGQRNAQTRLM